MPALCYAKGSTSLRIRWTWPWPRGEACEGATVLHVKILCEDTREIEGKECPDYKDRAREMFACLKNQRVKGAYGYGKYSHKNNRSNVQTA